MKTNSDKFNRLFDAARAAVGELFYDLPNCDPLTREQVKARYGIELPAGVLMINRYCDQFQVDIAE